MRNHNYLAASLVVYGLFAFTLPAAAAGFHSVASEHEVAQCVAEIGARADYSDAARVEHAVLSEKRRIGYELTIDTVVYSDIDGEVIREYATSCVPTLSEEPRRFRIEQTSGGA